MSGLAHIDTRAHPLGDHDYLASCRARLADAGALVLPGFFRPETISRIVEACRTAERDAYYADATHNVYLTEPVAALPPDHPANRQVVSSKGLIADDEIAADSPLREVYGDPAFRSFLAHVLDVEELHPYADALSSINVHFAPAGRELGWHFDESSFAVTMLLQAAVGGGCFEYVPGVRGGGCAVEDEHAAIAAVLDGDTMGRRLAFEPGDLVVFRGHDALHRVTPTEGPVTRMLVVFAFNEAPDVRLSDSALRTFYGRCS